MRKTNNDKKPDAVTAAIDWIKYTANKDMHRIEGIKRTLKTQPPHFRQTCRCNDDEYLLSEVNHLQKEVAIAQRIITGLRKTKQKSTNITAIWKEEIVEPLDGNGD